LTTVVLLPCGIALMRSAGVGAGGIAGGVAQPTNSKKAIRSVDFDQRDENMLATVQSLVHASPKRKQFWFEIEYRRAAAIGLNRLEKVCGLYRFSGPWHPDSNVLMQLFQIHSY